MTVFTIRREKVAPHVFQIFHFCFALVCFHEIISKNNCIETISSMHHLHYANSQQYPEECHNHVPLGPNYKHTKFNWNSTPCLSVVWDERNAGRFQENKEGLDCIFPGSNTLVMCWKQKIFKPEEIEKDGFNEEEYSTEAWVEHRRSCKWWYWFSATMIILFLIDFLTLFLFQDAMKAAKL